MRFVTPLQIKTMVERCILRRGIMARKAMAISARVLFWSALLVTVVIASANADDVGAEETTPSAVLTLDASNFDETIARHAFLAVEFYAPWCGHCKKLEPEFEKAASELSKHDPPIVLAKVDASNEVNKELASTYEIRGFPTLKIIRNYGKHIQEYKGPRDADGIVEYLKKQAGPASTEITSCKDAANLIDDKKVFIVGIFPEYSGEEFDNFTALAEKLRSDYDFGHTIDAKLLHRGDISVKGPAIRLFKPFDELFVDFQDFHADALESFIETASVPVVTTFNKDPLNHPFVTKFFNNQKSKVMLFINFSEQYFDSFKSKYYEIAENYKDKAISFLLGDLEASKGAFQYFGVKEDQAPLIILQENDAKKFLKPNIEPDQIATWLKEYFDGNLTPFVKSEPIPEVNNEPVKVVVANSLHDVVLESGKNVLLEFYAPWCGHCKKLAPILEEVAVSFQHDDDVIIAKMDATANDIPNVFEVQGYPTIYFSSANGKLLKYEEGRTAEDFIDFIKKNKHSDFTESIETDFAEIIETDFAESIETDFVKDEL